MTKKRWVSLFVENDSGILAKISGLFAGKAYNLDTITAGITDDPTLTRITIALTSGDETFEQIKKQLNRCVGVVKVMDFTEVDTFMKELIFIKIKECGRRDKEEIFQIAEVFNAKVIDYGADSILIEGVNTDKRNNELIEIMKKFGKIEIVRSGVVAIETIGGK